MNMPDTTGHEVTVQIFLSHPEFASALPGENRTIKIFHFCPSEYYYLIKITHKNVLSIFLSL